MLKGLVFKVTSCLIFKPDKINMFIFHPIKHNAFLRIPNALLPVFYVEAKEIKDKVVVREVCPG